MTDPTRQIGLPYCGQYSSEIPWFLQFNADPVVIAVLVLAAAGTLMGEREYRGWRAGAVIVASVLWVSPLCAASATLLSVRAVHHLAVMLVLAPLIAMSWGRRSAVPDDASRALGWSLASAIVFASWFWPAAYSAAWNSAGVYWAMQLAMLGAATGFWRAVLGLFWQRESFAAVPACALSLAAMGAVGAVLTFSPEVLLTEHLTASLGLGVAPLADQQLAGLLIWALGMVPLGICAMYAVQRGWPDAGSPAAVKEA